MELETKLNAWGEVPRKVKNHTLDSTRWYDFRFRDGDIVIATWAKTGTTWVKQIIGQLIFNGHEDIPVCDLCPWVDQRCFPKEALLPMLEEQLHRRFVKTHLPVDALVFSSRAKYIYMGRDGRDVICSLYHHHKNLTPLVYEMIKAVSDYTGPPFEPPTGGFREYFHAWLDGNGFPLWPFWSHVQSWWDLRDQPNVLLMHFANLKADLPNEIRRLAKFLEIDIDEAIWLKILEHCSFKYMKANASRLSSILDISFVGGARTFINQGVSGRWSGMLTAKDIEKYEGHARRNLTSDCAHWLATGEIR